MTTQDISFFWKFVVSPGKSTTKVFISMLLNEATHHLELVNVLLLRRRGVVGSIREKQHQVPLDMAVRVVTPEDSRWSLSEVSIHKVPRSMGTPRDGCSL